MPGIYTFLENRIFGILREHPVWPANIFKLECEKYGIYQDATGAVLKELLENGDIDKVAISAGNNTYPFFTEIGRDEDDVDDEIIEAIVKLDEFQNNYAYFAELASYVALCKVHDEIGENIPGFDVLPKGPRPHILPSSDGDPDGLAMLPGEYIPIEVYNGRDYLGTGGEKHGQLVDFASEDGTPGNPIIINRRSDQRIKQEARDLDGLVIDTGMMIGCETAVPDLDEVLDFLNISELYEIVPPLETSDGEVLDGGDFHSIALNGEQGGKLRPPAKMVDAADELPEQYLKRVRGGIQLQFVNSYYRRSTGRTERDASLVLQNLYNILLREDGRDRQSVIDEAWESTINNYRNVKSIMARQDMVLEQTETFLKSLLDENVVFQRSGNIYARASEHPQQSLSFK